MTRKYFAFCAKSYTLLKLHILPSVFLNMDEREKAFVTASIKKRIEDKKEEERKLKNKIH